MKTLSIEEKVENSEIHGGILSWYGLRARPADIGATPKGHSAIFSKDEALTLFPALRDANNVRYGAICFPELLTEKDTSSYELVLLSKEHAIEQKYLTSIATSPLQKHLISVLVNIIFQDMDAYTIIELENDGDIIIEQAFNKTELYDLRFALPKQFQVFFACMKTIKADAVIARLIELVKEDDNDASN